MSSRLSNFASALLGALTVAVVVVVLALAGVLDGPDDAAPAAQRTPAAPVPTSSTSSTSTPAASTATNGAESVADVYQRVNTGVVQVLVRQQTGAATGSGFVLDRQGYLLTNDHVVDTAKTAQIRFAGQDQAVSARVVGADPSSDLALLKVDPSQVKRLTPLPLGDDARLRVGQPTIALGSPFGLAGTLTTGVVSALDRAIPAPNDFTIDGAIQTDAAINPGNSGGPLLDEHGRVIGINAQIQTNGADANSGVGFAIPIDTAKDVVPELRTTGEVRRPYLGVSTGATQSGIGVLVAGVAPGDPADDAGVRAGDVILRVAGKVTNHPEDVAAAIQGRRIGERVDLTIRRGGQQRAVTVKLAERPQQVRTR